MSTTFRTCSAVAIGRALFALLLAAVSAQPAHANPANQSAPWKLNGNGYPGDVTVQQAPDGALRGSIYGDPLTGYYAPGERIGVWLRGPAGRPIQAFIGQAGPDGMSFSGRLYALNASNAGGSPARNLFAFSAQRAAAAAPGNPGVPASAAGPASVAGAHQINGNGFVGPLQLNQAPDGTLTGTIYGQMLEGHYASGTGSIALIRYSGPGQPFQLFVGSVTPQGMRGEFYALNGGAGASLQRMRFEWSTTSSPPAAAGAFIGPGGRPAPTSGVALLPALPPQPQPPVAGTAPANAATAPQSPAFFSGHVLVRAQDITSINPGTEASTVAQCPAGKVVSGFENVSSAISDGAYVIENAPLPDGSGLRLRIFNGTLVNPWLGASPGTFRLGAICINRPDGYQIVESGRNLSAQQRAVVETGCPAGKVLIGGGTRTGRAVYTAASGPRADGNAWQAHFRNDLRLPGAESAAVVAICVSDRYAAARSLLVSPDSGIGRGAVVERIQLVCSGRKGLSAGIYSSTTAIGYGGVSYLETPNRPLQPETWIVSIRNLDADQAVVGLRALCGSFQ